MPETTGEFGSADFKIPCQISAEKHNSTVQRKYAPVRQCAFAEVPGGYFLKYVHEYLFDSNLWFGCPVFDVDALGQGGRPVFDVDALGSMSMS